MRTFNNARLARSFSALGIVYVLMLSGCETGKTPQEKAAPVANNEKVASNNINGGSTAIGVNNGKAIPVEQQVDYATLNPVSITFDKSSAELTDDDKKILAAITERAKHARQITITGFCDRNQFANAQAAAIKRATVVKEELISLGVTSPMRIKYETKTADKHAVEIQF